MVTDFSTEYRPAPFPVAMPCSPAALDGLKDENTLKDEREVSHIGRLDSPPFDGQFDYSIMPAVPLAKWNRFEVGPSRSAKLCGRYRVNTSNSKGKLGILVRPTPGWVGRHLETSMTDGIMHPSISEHSWIIPAEQVFRYISIIAGSSQPGYQTRLCWRMCIPRCTRGFSGEA